MSASDPSGLDKNPDKIKYRGLVSPERRVKSDGRYYRGIRANPDLCDGPATKYVGYFRREKRPGQSIANTRRSLRFRSRAELHSDRFACRCSAVLGASAYCIGCQKYSTLEAVCISTKQQRRLLSKIAILVSASGPTMIPFR